MRGRWLLPDVGYFDNGYGKDQIWFVAGGAEVLHRPRFDWTQEIYFTQDANTGADNKRSLWFWQVFDMRSGRKYSAQIVPYPTIPLNHAQQWGFDIDRAKVERTVGSQWLAGVGYSGGIDSSGSWQSRPFLTTTRKSRAGDFEFWLERMPGGAQVQVRYTLVQAGK
jgi:hypothetical protein